MPALVGEHDGEDEAASEEKVQKATSIAFGKRMCHTDKKVRDKGFRHLRSWLKKQGGDLDRLDFMKLWKGLYYCMWMSDKRHIQQDLAVQMALLINDLPIEKQPEWIDTFWETMGKGWESLDVHRCSKYLLFVRIVLSEAFKVLRERGWKVQEVKELSEAILRGVPAKRELGVNTTSIGLNMQFTRILWEELRPQMAQEPAITIEGLMAFLEPYIAMAENSCHKGFVDCIHRYLFKGVPEQIQGLVMSRLLKGAARVDILRYNRKLLYESADNLEAPPEAYVPPVLGSVEEPEQKHLPRAPPSQKQKKRNLRAKLKKKAREGAQEEMADGGQEASEGQAAPAEAEEGPPAKKAKKARKGGT